MSDIWAPGFWELECLARYRQTEVDRTCFVKTAKNQKFSAKIVDAFRNAKIIGARAGTEHRYTGVWVVVVGDRVFARSWSDKPTGWFRAFKKEPLGTVQVGKIEVPVQAKQVSSARVRDSVTEAFAEKYNTKGSKQWVDGFREHQRAINTVEFVRR
jgi:hypothetical protein